MGYRVTQVQPGRIVEDLRTSDADIPAVAELIEPGTESETVLARIEATRRSIREAYTTVMDARSIDALTT